MHRWLALWVVAAAAMALGTGCGVRNLGEKCALPGAPAPVGDVLCAPGRCDPDLGVCVECLTDIDCFRDDPFDRPRCMKNVTVAQGGDGIPYCKHIADHPACAVAQGGSDLLCFPGKCHPDAGVCVECLADGDCTDSSRPECDPGIGPDYLPFCRER